MIWTIFFTPIGVRAVERVATAATSDTNRTNREREDKDVCERKKEVISCSICVNDREG